MPASDPKERLKIRTTFNVPNTSYHDLNLSLGQLEELVIGWRIAYGRDAIFDIDISNGYDGCIDCYITITTIRDETDEEYNKRQERLDRERNAAAERNKRAKITKQANDLAELERLAKLYPEKLNDLTKGNNE